MTVVCLSLDKVGTCASMYIQSNYPDIGLLLMDILGFTDLETYTTLSSGQRRSAPCWLRWSTAGWHPSGARDAPPTWASIATSPAPPATGWWATPSGRARPAECGPQKPPVLTVRRVSVARVSPG